jgi:hypothetical protein
MFARDQFIEEDFRGEEKEQNGENDKGDSDWQEAFEGSAAGEWGKPERTGSKAPARELCRGRRTSAPRRPNRGHRGADEAAQPD